VSPRFTVRPALFGDLTNVLGVLAQNQADSPSDGASPKQHDTASDTQIAMWERVQASPDVVVYVAETASGDAVGTACLSILPNITYDCRPTAFIEAVVVAYAHRRQGVATLLLERLLTDARAADCYKVQLLSHKRHANDGAHDVYVGLGFVPEAEGFRHYLT
jgi:GNAT superfamily N-acetyltransferase